MDHFSLAYKDFRLTISLKKTNVLGQNTMELSAITIDDYELDVVEQFTYLGSTITDNLFQANLPSMFTLLRQRRLRWLGHVYRMEDGHIPKENSLWRVGIWKRIQRPPTAAVQGRLQERHEST